jgi:hypothetical protein
MISGGRMSVGPARPAAPGTAPAEPERIAEIVMLVDQWIPRSRVEAAWAQRIGAVLQVVDDPGYQGNHGTFVAPTYKAHIDKAEAGVIASQIDSLISFGLILQKGSDILLPNSEARQALKDARGAPEHRDRTVTMLVVDEDGDQKWLPRGPETDAEISRIAQARGEDERPHMVVPCAKGHEPPSYYIADDGRRKCRTCRREKPVLAPRSTVALQ